MSNKTAIITGGARGIGKNIALKLAKNNINIVIFDLLDNEAEETINEITKLGIKAKYYKIDITDEDKVKQAIDEISKEFGRIDILINNAGITKDKLLMKMTKEDFKKVIDVNLVGSFICTQSVIRLMLRQRYGRIINISSVVGLFGNAGQANYASSKAGLIGLTKSVAKEVSAKGITVNAICPGFIESDMTKKLNDKVRENYLNNIPAKKFGTAEDISNLIGFLVSDASSYITGEVIRVDGGLAM